MIKPCKYCGIEINVTGKREFCSDKCRKAYSYAKKTGKITSTIPNLEIPDGTEPDHEILGTVVKVATTARGTVVAQIDFSLEESKGISMFWNKPVKVLFYNYVHTKSKGKDPTDDLFDDYAPYMD